MRGNDYERRRHRQEIAAYSLSRDSAPKPTAQPQCAPFAPLHEVLLHKVMSNDCARLRAGIGAFFAMAGLDIK